MRITGEKGIKSYERKEDELKAQISKVNEVDLFKKHFGSLGNLK